VYRLARCLVRLRLLASENLKAAEGIQQTGTLIKNKRRKADMMKLCAVVPVFLLTLLGWSDTLKLKNGSTLIGTYAGGSDQDIAFRVSSTVQHYNIADVASLTFDSRASMADSSGVVSRPPAEQTFSEPPRSTNRPLSDNVTVPVGTRLVVRMIDAIDSDKNHVGDRFQATLEEALFVDNSMVVPRGADVYGRLEQVSEGGQLAGKSQLKLALTGIVLHGRTVPLVTGDYEVSGKSRGASTAKKVGGGAALGAVIGAIAGGGKGAAIGAGVGAGAGTAVQVMTKGDQVHVPSETVLEFVLNQSLTMERVQ
jgi:hypothetical protein